MDVEEAGSEEALTQEICNSGENQILRNGSRQKMGQKKKDGQLDTRGETRSGSSNQGPRLTERLEKKHQQRQLEPGGACL